MISVFLIYLTGSCDGIVCVETTDWMVQGSEPGRADHPHLSSIGLLDV